MRPARSVGCLGLVVVALWLVGAAPALADGHEGSETTQSGQGSDESRSLEATFEPTPEAGIYSGRYLFAMSRGLADSTLHPALQAPLFLITIPVDIVLLPVTAIAGFF